ncbi:hypothetical protein Hanom_Chr05g00415521 [Helianthus anomalus]
MSCFWIKRPLITKASAHQLHHQPYQLVLHVYALFKIIKGKKQVAKLLKESTWVVFCLKLVYAPPALWDGKRNISQFNNMHVFQLPIHTTHNTISIKICVSKNFCFNKVCTK